MLPADSAKIKKLGNALCHRWGALLRADLDPTANVEAKQAYEGTLKLMEELGLITDYGIKDGVSLPAAPLRTPFKAEPSVTRTRKRQL